mmetsp:Transcript_7895/g.18482  ORF Transcript_7895/g.18482 Transcript_7895/m.18482 type:complete len:515 (+) Transcript_7895:138-1682(+)
MGAMLPKPVESTVVERHGTKEFLVGVAEMNGWRANMEDAHVIHLKEEWGFFGVFDGHGGDKCSKFVAKRIQEELDTKGCPADDAAVKQLVLSIDQEFLDSQQESGSTATMCIVHKPRADGTHKLRVVNAGDSRVLLGRRDGSIVDGGGTDQGLTVDHKPNHPDEKERIYRCGGHVEESDGGVARVNGDLAVSRGFGDADYKKTGGPGPEDHPVTADPELGEFECSDSDFLLLVCDGVSEGDFSNPQVVKLVADCLQENNDPGLAAKAVCHRAVDTNSKDNITCMVVLFSGATKPEELGKSVNFHPGPLWVTDHRQFLNAWIAMASKAELTLAQALDKRYEVVQEELAAPTTNAQKLEQLRDELTKLGTPEGEIGSASRTEWFEQKAKDLLSDEDHSADSQEGGGLSMGLMRMLAQHPGGQHALMQILGGANGNRGGAVQPTGRRVIAPSLEALKTAVEGHSKLSWDPRLANLANAEGEVRKDDPSDGTTNVFFPPPIGLCAWLPTDILKDVPSA